MLWGLQTLFFFAESSPKLKDFQVFSSRLCELEMRGCFKIFGSEFCESFCRVFSTNITWFVFDFKFLLFSSSWNVSHRNVLKCYSKFQTQMSWSKPLLFLFLKKVCLTSFLKTFVFEKITCRSRESIGVRHMHVRDGCARKNFALSHWCCKNLSKIGFFSKIFSGV